MDLSLRDALGGGGGGAAGGAPAESLLKRDFVASLEKQSYDDKVGETVSKSEYRPLLDGKDSKTGPGMMSSMMSSSRRQDPPGQPAFSSDYLSGPMMGGRTDQWSMNKTKDNSMPDSFLGFPQSGMGGTMGSGLPPFQTSMSTPLSQTGTGSAMDTQKSSGLFGVDNKTSSNTSGSSPFKTSDPFSSGSPGIHSMDHSAAPVLPPSGSMDDSSPTSSASEPLSPERVGPGGEAGKEQQRRRKKKRKGRDHVYDFLASQEQNVGQSDKQGRQDKGGLEVEDDEDDEGNWEWEIRESGGGGRVKGRKTKSRARLPEEWGVTQPPTLPPLATVAPTTATTANSGLVFDSRTSNPGSVLTSPPEQIPATFTNRSHASPVTDASPRSYEPMCVDDFALSNKDGPKANQQKVLAGKPEFKGSRAGDDSLALISGDNLSPVSQTFSFLDSVLQTPPGCTPDSQTPTPVTCTPSLATASLTKSTLAEVGVPASPGTSVPNSSTSPSLVFSVGTHPPATAVGSALNVDAKPFVPMATLLSSPTTLGSTAAIQSATTLAMPFNSSASSCKNEATLTALSDTPPKSVVTPITATSLPSVTLAAPPVLPAHSEHQESSSRQLPLLEVKSDKQVKTDIMPGKTDKFDNFDKKEKDEQQKKDTLPDKNQKSEKLLKDEVEKLNANERAEKVDKPEKTNKDDKKEEDKGGKGAAKSPAGNGGKTLPSPDGKIKTPENDKRPAGPKVAPTARPAAGKNGSSAPAASRTAANKNDKTDNKTGEAKKPKTTARPRPASATTPVASTNGEASHRRRVITKPPVPKQTPMEKKPAVPRAPRTPRPINAPTPDLKNVRSKIGSIDNIKYQPGGGKVSSTPNNKTSDPSTPAAKAKTETETKEESICSLLQGSLRYDNVGNETTMTTYCGENLCQCGRRVGPSSLAVVEQPLTTAQM
uniref:microtubule-associated protein 4-like isoform X5 n=1 Tax=Gasterosteus aculeatus aculeatus TaxID=481459 RepID=UPI001A98BA21|nr:microtubule-associated protein 4-like isoform X5 [Gasterosteus aculeatus aculeatus]